MISMATLQAHKPSAWEDAWPVSILLSGGASPAAFFERGRARGGSRNSLGLVVRIPGFPFRFCCTFLGLLCLLFLGLYVGLVIDPRFVGNT